MRWGQLGLYPLPEQPWAWWGKSHTTRTVLLLRKVTEVSASLLGPKGVPATPQHQSTTGQTILGTGTHQQQHSLESLGNTEGGIKPHTFPKYCLYQALHPLPWPAPAGACCFQSLLPEAGAVWLCFAQESISPSPSWKDSKVHRLTQIPSYTTVAVLLTMLCPLYIFFLQDRASPSKVLWVSNRTGPIFGSTLTQLHVIFTAEQEDLAERLL